MTSSTRAYERLCILPRVYRRFRLAVLLVGSERVNAVKAILIAVGLLILAWVVLAFFEALPPAVNIVGGH